MSYKYTNNNICRIIIIIIIIKAGTLVLYSEGD